MAEEKQQSLWDTFIQQVKGEYNTVKRAVSWFKKNLELLSTVHGNVLMGKDRQRLVPVSGLTPRHTGRMIMFFYDPKWKNKLPYYDRFPLVLPIKFYKDGFLGLNLHYLPIQLRARLLDHLYTNYKSRQFDENKKLQLNYEAINTAVKMFDLKGRSSTLRYASPCIHRYLYSHCRSRFYVVDPNEWNMMLMLPTERFEKKSTEAVWEASRQKLGIRN